MAENRDEILNELIKYYDGDEPSDDSTAKENTADGAADKDTKPQEEDMGHTRVISKGTQSGKAQPLGGDTVVVNIGRQSNQGEKQTASDNTDSNLPYQEEILGNLGLDGKPIAAEVKQKPSPERQPQKRAEVNKTPRRDSSISFKQLSENDTQVNAEEEKFDAKSGVWHTLKPLWVTLIITAIAVVVFAFYTTDTGIIGTYKRNFEYNMSVILDIFGIDFDNDDALTPIAGGQGDDKVMLDSDNGEVQSSSGLRAQTDSETAEQISYVASGEKKVTIPFEDAGSSDFSLFDNGVVCVKSNYMCYIDKNGNKKWENDTSISNPIVKSAGKYIAVASLGGTRFELYEGEKLCYSIDAPNKIKMCDVSQRGDVVLAADKNAYKGSVIVFNKKGEQIFSWVSGMNYITDVSMLRTRLVAVSLVDASDEVTSYVMMFDVRQPDPISGVRLDNTLVFDVENNGKNVFATGDNSIASITGYSYINYDIRFDDVLLWRTSCDENEKRLIVYSRDNEPVLNVYSGKGELVYDAVIETLPDKTDIYGKTILYSSDRDIICGKYTETERSVYTAPMTVKQLMLLDSSSYMLVYENILEIIKFE
jgi:hypothetical protein